MYQSALMLDYHAASIDLELQLPESRLSKVFGQELTSVSLAKYQPELQGYILSRVHAWTPQQTEWAVQFASPLVLTNIDGAPYVVAHLVLRPPQSASVRDLTIEDNVITDSLPSQVVLVSVRSDWASSTFASDPDLIGVINGEERSIEIDLRSGNWTRGFRSVFRLGVRHIAEGTDHLLFLLALLLPAPLLCSANRWAGFTSVRHSFRQILRVVTAFTLGHSLTLALAASGVVRVPGKPIEVLIAISIFISAIHAVRPLFPGREAIIAGGFGLVHGLAFASTLAELGLRNWERVASIFAFNMGIEAMQLLVVVCIMPSLVLLSRTRLYTLFRLAGATFAGLASLGWIVERVSSRSLSVDRVVGGLAQHSVPFAAALFCVSSLAYLYRPNSHSHSQPA